MTTMIWDKEKQWRQQQEQGKRENDTALKTMANNNDMTADNNNKRTINRNWTKSQQQHLVIINVTLFLIDYYFYIQ